MEILKNHDENKTYILVKLSESLSNAIQEYSTPTIRFHGSRGAIKFANGKNYDFSLEPSVNAVECLRQTKHRWESVGKVACCMNIKGKDDVYQRTRTKMEAAEQEKRKYCTKLLGQEEKCNNNNTNTTNNNNYLITSKYPEIADTKQLKKYKADFDKDMKEYQSLHGYLQRIEERFRKLRDLLKQSGEGSPEWESAKEQIFTEYERFKSDSNFHKARSKYKQLSHKLGHIKEKIFQFKRQHRDKPKKKRKRRC